MMAATVPVAAATAITAASFFAALLSTIIDANPTLYLYSSLVLSDNSLTRSWSGRNVVLVGASSGIGAELAELLAGYGANVVLTGRDKKRLNEVANRCRSISRAAAIGPSSDDDDVASNERMIKPLQLDITASDRTLNRAIDTASSSLPGGNIDVVVLNAGQGQLLPAMQTPHETTRDLMETNFHGPVRFARLLMHRNKWMERRRGHIVVTSSVLGKIPGPLSSSYAAAKHAVQGYFGTLRAENSWLRVDLPCPGPVDTLFGQRARTERSKHGKKGNGIGRSSGDNAAAAEAGSYRSKMPAERCAVLILAAMTGPQSLFYETLIMRQPTLGFSYLAQHLPTLANMAVRKMGPLRTLVWEAGLPLYDSASFRKVAQMQKDNDK